jgi:thioredoxin-related protein
MQKIVVAICCMLPIILKAQTEKVMFTKAENWKEVLTKAKEEHKYIFLDFYATWCGPCKKMDAEVYIDEKVAIYANKNFISVKIQIDRTKNDASQEKKWYSDADVLKNDYQINAFPSFLFFSPDGDLVQRSEGYHDAGNFLLLLRKANNPHTNYAGLIRQYKEGGILEKDLLPLALEAQASHNDILANEIAMKYKTAKLEKQDSKKLMSKRLLDFLSAFYPLVSVNDKITKYMYQNPAGFDVAFGINGYSTKLTDYVITKDIINPVTEFNDGYVDKVPDWSTLEKEIGNSYDMSTAARLIINAKLNWYTEKKDWANIAKYSMEKLDKQLIDTTLLGSFNLNNMIFNVLVRHSDDQVVLNKGLSYMEQILKSNSNRDSYIDTYASLLYKIGNKEEAIKHELNAIEIASKRKDSASIQEYQQTLKKMRNDLPLW